MKKILCLFLPLLLFANTIKAHQDSYYVLDSENVHIRYLTGFEDYEIKNKFTILFELLNEYYSVIDDTTVVYIDFLHDNSNRDTGVYSLLYGNYTYTKYAEGKYDLYKNGRNEIPFLGIYLRVRDMDFDIKEVLNLIHGAIQDKVYLSERTVAINYTSFFKHIRIDSSVSNDWIDKYKYGNYEIINQLLVEKFIVRGEDRNQKIMYYFKDNQYFITSKSDTTNVIIELDKVYYIYEGIGIGNLVFINDSMFYQINNEKFVSDVYTIRNSRFNCPIFKHEFNCFPIPHFIIQSYHSKTLFVPDSTKVIGNFNLIYGDLISFLSTNKHNVKTMEREKEKTENWYMPVILGLLLLANIFLVLNYGLKRKSEKEF